MGTRLVYDVEGAPSWLTRVPESEKFSGTPEPGHYDFVIVAYVVENDIQSSVSRERLAGSVEFQTPIWQTPAYQDAVFTDVPGAVELSATSYEALVTYSSPGAGDGVEVGSEGTLTYSFVTSGRHVVPVDAMASAKEGAEEITQGLVKPVSRRDFEFWALVALDLRTVEEVLSDTMQSLRDGTAPPASPDPMMFAADQTEIDTYCDVRAFVYAAGSSLAPDVQLDHGAVLWLGGVSVLRHTVSYTQGAHIIEPSEVNGVTPAPHTFPIGTDPRMFVALFDRRKQTVRVVALLLHVGEFEDGTLSSMTAVPSAAPQYWDGAAWVQDEEPAVGTSSFVSSTQDPRVQRMLDDMTTPLAWPLAFWMGAYLVGDPMQIDLAYPETSFEVLEINAPGLSGIATSGVSGTPSASGTSYFTARATETPTQLYSTAEIELEFVSLQWEPKTTERTARVGDTVEQVTSLVPSHAAAIEIDNRAPDSGLAGVVSVNDVTVSGTIAIVGTHVVVATASVAVRDETVQSSASVTFVVFNQLAIWATPTADDLAMMYSGREFSVGLQATAPEPIQYRVAPDEVVQPGESIRVVDSDLFLNLPDGARSIKVDAFIDEETITPTIVYAHAFDKVEDRPLVEIASDSEAALLQGTPALAHATSYPASGPVYRYGTHLVYVVDVRGGSTTLECNGGSIVTHSARIEGGVVQPGSVLSLAGSQSNVESEDDIGVCVVTISTDGNLRARFGSINVTGFARTTGFAEAVDLDFTFTGEAAVGSVYATPSFDDLPPVASAYALTRPFFVSSTVPAYVYTGEPFNVPAVTQTPDPRLSFEVTTFEGVSLPQADPYYAFVSGTVIDDGPASVTVRATRTNGTWLDGVVTLEGLTIHWPGLDLGEATIGTTKEFDFQVTSTYAVNLTIPSSEAPNALSIVSSVGEEGRVRIVPDAVGPASAEVVAITKGVEKSRTVYVLVRHTAPVWTGGAQRSETVFLGSAFQRTFEAVCSGRTSYALVSVEPFDERNETIVDAGLGITRARLQNSADIVVRASAPDGVLNVDDLRYSIEAYDPGNIYGASESTPDGPPVVTLLGPIRSKVRFEVFSQQLGAGAAMRFFPVTDEVTLRHGGVIVYSIDFEIDAQGSGIATRIPGVADIVHTPAANNHINVAIHAPSVGAYDTNPGASQTGSVALASGSVAAEVVSNTLGSVMVVQWDRDGTVTASSDPGATPDAVIAPGSAGANLPVDVLAEDIAMDVTDAGTSRVGGHMLATFPASARLIDWRDTYD